MLAEELREAILDLERARAKEKNLRLESESLLNGLQMLSLSSSKSEVFIKLLEVLKRPIQFQDAFILKQDPNTLELSTEIATSPLLEHTLWKPQKSFQRVLNGKPLLAFDVRFIKEWKEQPKQIKQCVTSAIHIPFHSEQHQGMFICTHSQQGFFTQSQLKLSQRLVSLASKALLQIELTQSRDSALNASRMKSLFLANMSHELRTPLSTIIGYTDLLLEEFEEEGNTTYIDDLCKIKKAADHLLLLINNILDLTKIEAGKMELYYEPLTLSTFLDELKTMVEPLAQKNNNQLVIEKEYKEDIFTTDVVRLRQLLLNLLSNACKFTQDGTITLSIQEETREGKRWFIFCVSDTGIGMNEEQMQQVFKEFTQADVSTTRKFGGTGLGLTLSQRICSLMQGHIHLESTLSKGSAFTIELPEQDPS